MSDDHVVNLSERRARTTRRFSKRLAQDFLDEIAVTDPELASLKTQAMAHYIAMESSDLIRTMRERAELTQKELADALGVKQSRIAFLESGKSTQGPTLGTLLKIAFICNQQVIVEDEPSPRDTKKRAEVAQIQQSISENYVPQRAPAPAWKEGSDLQQVAGKPGQKRNPQFE